MKRTRRRNMLFITLGILAILFLGYVIYAVFLKDSKQTEDILIVSENQAESDVKRDTVPLESDAKMDSALSESDIKIVTAPSESEMKMVTASSESDAKMVTLPFKAEFSAQYTARNEDFFRCGELPFIRMIVDGRGTEPNFGEIAAHLDFCSERGGNVYLDVMGWFVTAEGDSLFVSCWGGQIKDVDENDPPYYLNKWSDPFEFTGGTGRFEGATGEGMMHGYNHRVDYLTYHTWEGTLTMKAE